jgi:acyl-CoA synthetase (NDP forming)
MTTTLSEVESKKLLAGYGLPILEGRTVKTAPAAVEASDAIGYPSVLKLCGDGIAHKTERNLVRLSLGSAAEVDRAAPELLSQATADDGDVELLGIECLTSITQVPAGQADLVYVCVPAAAVAQVLRDAASVGIRAAVIASSGFGEGNDDEGAAHGAELAALADELGMVIAGPTLSNPENPGPATLREHGHPCYTSPADVVAAFSALFARGRHLHQQ